MKSWYLSAGSCQGDASAGEQPDPRPGPSDCTKDERYSVAEQMFERYDGVEAQSLSSTQAAGHNYLRLNTNIRSNPAAGFADCYRRAQFTPGGFIGRGGRPFMQKSEQARALQPQGPRPHSRVARPTAA